MATQLPAVPFDKQVYIDAQRVKWQWSVQSQIWCRIGPADTLPIADDTTIGLMTAVDKLLLDSVPEAGGGFGLIVAPQLILATPENPTGAMQGDIVLCSESLNIDCVSASGFALDEDGCGVCDDIGFDSQGNAILIAAPGLRFSLSQVFLDTLCVEVTGPQGPRGLKGSDGDKGTDGFSDSPVGDRGLSGFSIEEAHTFTGIKVVELEEIKDEAIVHMELNGPDGILSYTKSKMNVPEDDEPADQLVVTPINRALFYPLLADNPEEYLTLDDWHLTIPSGDSLPDDTDILLLKVDEKVAVGDVVEIKTVRLTELIKGIVDFYKGKLEEFDTAWLKEVKEFIEAKDAAARAILAAMAMRVAECEWQRPLEFCIGIKADECQPGPPAIPDILISRSVIIAIYDESNGIDPQGSYNSPNPAPPYATDLAIWNNLIQTHTDANVRAGMLQPEPNQDKFGTGGLDELLPSGSSLPPDTERSRITYKHVSFKTARLVEADILSIFNSMTDNGDFDPTVVIFVLDDSSSIFVADYEAELIKAKATILAAHPTTTILENRITTHPENWLGAMASSFETVILTGTL